MNIDRQTRTARRYVFTTPAFIAIRWRQAHVFNFHLAAKHTASIEDCKYYYKISTFGRENTYATTTLRRMGRRGTG